MKTKRILSVFLTALTLLLPLSACANTSDGDSRISIVTTNFALYDLARAVCGDGCKVEMLISPGSESHDFEATLTDMAKIADADLFVYVGGESEEWVDGVFESMGKSADGIRKIRALDIVSTYTEEELPGLSHDHGDHGDHGTIDEHVWTSIPNAVAIMEKISEELYRIDERVSDYVDPELIREYRYELLKLHEEYKSVVESASRKAIVVADRFPFRYMVEEYGLEYYAAFSGCSSDTEPALTTVNFLVETVKNEAIPAIFIIEFSSGATARAVADETGAEILTLHSAHNVTKEDFDSGITYLEIMRQNLEALKSALN